jgi:NAD(P)-dependent dehydrogenase (short-subunit alcohol dehydrogenase family)
LPYRSECGVARQHAAWARILMRTPMERLDRTEELFGAAVYLASDAASFVTEQPWSSMEAFWPATSINSCAQRKE